jgi:large subunit ribosomal protein L4
VPLRRDIIHNAFHYFEKKDRYILKKTKDFGDVAGSGKKPTPQKGGGRSRQGNRRAPQRAGGGIAHGPVPRCLGFPLNSKTRLLALKCMLSAKLYEERLIVIDSESLEYPKTQLLEAIIKPYGIDKLLFLVPEETDKNFIFASRNLQNVVLKKASEFNVPELLRSDFVFMTKQGLQEIEMVIEKREGNYFRNKKTTRPEIIAAKQAKRKDTFVSQIMEPILEQGELENFDDSVPL